MIRTVKKFLQINLIIFRNAYIRDSKIPGFIIASSLTQLLEVFFSLILFSIIFMNVKTLAGWNLWQVIFIYAYMRFVSGIHKIWTTKGLKSLAKELVRMGDYDFFITKPFNPMILVSISKPRLYCFIEMIFEFCLMLYCVQRSGSPVGFANIVWFTFLTFFGIALYYFLSVLCVIPAFWVTKLTTITDLINRMVQFAKYPSGIFPTTLRIMLSTFVPILVVSYFPSRTLFYPPEFSYIIYMVLITIVFGFITHWLWRLGEKNYGSASS